MERNLKAEARKKGLTGDRADAYVYGTLRKTGWEPKKEKNVKNATVEEAYDKKYGKKKKDKKSVKRKVMDVFIGLIPGGKKIKKATKKRTGSKTMDEKTIPR